MDIGSNNSYPSGALSNFEPYDITISGVECKSMESFLQSLNVQDQILHTLDGAQKTAKNLKN